MPRIRRTASCPQSGGSKHSEFPPVAMPASIPASGKGDECHSLLRPDDRARSSSTATTADDAIDYHWHALNGVVVWPVKTNAGLPHAGCRGPPAFTDGEIDTGFIASHLDEVCCRQTNRGEDAIATAATSFRVGGDT